MPGALVLSLEAAVLCYEAPGNPARALVFCSAVLDKEGWTESPEAGLRFVSCIFASTCYERSGYSLLFTARPAPLRPGMVTVTLQKMGNLDTRTLPKQRDATVIWGARISTVYATSWPVHAVADFTASALAAVGWCDCALVDSRRDQRHECQTFRFAKDGMSLAVRVTRALSRPGRTLVQYSASMVASDLRDRPDPGAHPVEGDPRSLQRGG
jgi:hypothetical protein